MLWARHQRIQEPTLQVDLHDFLTRLAGTVLMTLVPVILTAFLTMPFTLHRHADDLPRDPNLPVAHMT